MHIHQQKALNHAKHGLQRAIHHTKNKAPKAAKGKAVTKEAAPKDAEETVAPESPKERATKTQATTKHAKDRSKAASAQKAKKAT